MGAASPWAVPSPWACKGDTEGLGGLSCLLLQDEKSQQSQNSFPPANCSPAHFPTQESLTMWYQSLSQHRFKAGDAESDKVLLSLLITLLHWLPVTYDFMLHWVTGKSLPRQCVVMPMLILSELAAGNASCTRSSAQACYLGIWTRSLQKQSSKGVWALRQQFGLWDVFLWIGH